METMTTQTTAQNVTRAQIKQLRAEAGSAGDARMVQICDVALAAPPEHHDPSAAPLPGPDGQPLTRDAARAECARVIAAAEAQK